MKVSAFLPEGIDTSDSVALLMNHFSQRGKIILSPSLFEAEELLDQLIRQIPKFIVFTVTLF